MKSVAISRDSKRLFASNASGKILAWDIENGRLLRNSPEAMPAGSGPVRVFGRYRAEASGNLIRVRRMLSGEDLIRQQEEESRIESIRLAAELVSSTPRRSTRP